MRIEFKKDFRSITEFEPLETPSFVVITGVNGSGKSHLLQAIEAKSVSILGDEIKSISLFNYENFRLDNENLYSAQTIRKEKENAWNTFQTQIKKRSENIKKSTIGEYYNKGTETNPDSMPLFEIENSNLNKYKNGIMELLRENNLKNTQHANGITSIAKELPYPIDQISQNDFIELYRHIPLKNNLLPSQLGEAFWNYYIKFKENKIKSYENEKDGANHNVISDEDFFKKYGPKPWDIVNKILDTFKSLNYKVSSPEGLQYFDTFQLKLIHPDTQIELSFEDLSSGERILMALVASVYKSSSDSYFPDLLLLDEVDASLHPSMMKNMLDVIENVFLEHGTNVILVTHSPTTIALCPDDSIYVMNKFGAKRIEKKTKSEALSILTEGFATIDQGLKLFDQISSTKITIITEGDNAHIINKLLNMKNINGVEVLSGCESNTGVEQLKTLFRFFTKAQHDKDVIFVWDCDAKISHLSSENKTHPFLIPHNSQNKIAIKGIENAFPEQLFDGFTEIKIDSHGKKTHKFDLSRKKDFKELIISRINVSDFDHFDSLVDYITSLNKA